MIIDKLQRRDSRQVGRSADNPAGGRTILLVSDDPALTAVVCPSLEGAGFEVMVCPGPQGPEYECIAGHGGDCPLAHAASCVVMEGELAGDVAMQGTPS